MTKMQRAKYISVFLIVIFCRRQIWMSALLTMAAVNMCVSTARMEATIAYATKVSFFIATGNNVEVNHEKMEIHVSMLPRHLISYSVICSI